MNHKALKSDGKLKSLVQPLSATLVSVAGGNSYHISILRAAFDFLKHCATHPDNVENARQKFWTVIVDAEESVSSMPGCCSSKALMLHNKICNERSSYKA